jgi:hypothetical protein
MKPAVFLTLLLILALAACGGGSTANNLTSQNPGSSGGSGSGAWQRVTLPSAVTQLKPHSF